jgi:nitroreductase
MRKILKKLIPSKVVFKIQMLLQIARVRCLLVASQNSVYASLYYTVVSREFRRENMAVLNGRIAYQKSLEAIDDSCALLRRNIHRLEKGLIMQPRRVFFAANYIQETVNFFSKAINSTTLCNDEKKWAIDVLSNYFEIVEVNNITKAARIAFENSLELISRPGNLQDRYIPYKYSDLPRSKVNYEQLEVLFKRRRSVRWFKDRKVEVEKISKAILLASTAPSACNRQPYRFLFTNDEKKSIQIANCAMGTVGFSDNIPSIIVVTGDLAYYPFERDRHLIYIDSSLAAMQFMLTIDTLGLATCPINWPDIDQNEEQLNNILKLKSSERVVMLIAVGYPRLEGGIPYSQKKTNNILMKEI